jgi:ribose 5-phosphate isomerase B
MKSFVISLGADHRGVAAKKELKAFLEELGHTVIDVGTDSEVSCDHPDYAFKAGEYVTNGTADRVVLICGSGHGMLLSVNKVEGVMAVMPLDEEHGKMARLHNDANGCVFGSDFMAVTKMKLILKIWLDTEHLGGKYTHRVNKILQYEQRKMGKVS